MPLPETADKSSWDTQWVNAHDAFIEASEGDTVLYGDRKEDLVVQDKYEDNGRWVLELLGPNGGVITVREQYNPNGTPDFKDQRGVDATNLRITGSDTDFSDAGNEGDQADDPDVLERDGVQNWDFPTASQDAEETTGDNFAMGSSGDPYLDFDSFYESTFEDGPAQKSSLLTQTDAGTWTFVDELNALGQDVPKTVNNWTMIDYGVVRDGMTRKAVWLNADTDEAVAVGFVRDADQDSPTWYIWYTEDVNSDENSIDPELTTDDPTEALGELRDILYGDVDEVDIEISESDNGQITIRDGLDDATFGDKVYDVMGGVPTLPISISYPDGKAAWVGDSFSNFLTYLDNNKAKAGRVGKFVVVYSVVAISQRFTGVTVTPVLEEDRLGVEAHYKYDGKIGDFIRSKTNIGRTPAGGTGPRDAMGKAELQGEFTVNPQEFNLHKVNPKTPLGIDYDMLVEAGKLANLDDLEMKTPFSDAVESLRVAEDENGNVKVIREGGGSTTGKNVPSSSYRNSSRSKSAEKLAQDISESATGDATSPVLDGNSVSQSHSDSLQKALERQDDIVDEIQVAHANAIDYVSAWYDKNDDRDIEEQRTSQKVDDWWDAVDTIVETSSHGIERESIEDEVVFDAIPLVLEDGKTPMKAFRSASSTAAQSTRSTSSSSNSGSSSSSSDTGDKDPIAQAAKEDSGNALVNFDPDGRKGELDEYLSDMPSPSELSNEQVTAITNSLIQRRPDQWSSIEDQWVETYFPDIRSKAAEASGTEDVQAEMERVREYEEEEMEEGAAFADAWGAEEVEDAFGEGSATNMSETQDVPFDQRDDRL